MEQMGNRRFEQSDHWQDTFPNFSHTPVAPMLSVMTITTKDTDRTSKTIIPVMDSNGLRSIWITPLSEYHLISSTLVIYVLEVLWNSTPTTTPPAKPRIRPYGNQTLFRKIFVSTSTKKLRAYQL